MPTIFVVHLILNMRWIITQKCSKRWVGSSKNLSLSCLAQGAVLCRQGQQDALVFAAHVGPHGGLELPFFGYLQVGYLQALCTSWLGIYNHYLLAG